MQFEGRVAAVIELVDEYQAFEDAGRIVPSDAMVGKYFRSRRYIGSKDRGAISGLFYKILRHFSALAWHVEQAGDVAEGRTVTFAALLFLENTTENAIANICEKGRYAPEPLSGREQTVISRMAGKTYMDNTMPRHIQLHTPEWIMDAFNERYGNDGEALCNALNEEAPLDIRVNSLKTTLDDVSNLLLEEGIIAHPMALSKQGLRIEKRAALFGLQAFKDGWFEVQDEGSQIVASLVDAKAGQKVIDFCAGAGGKTLAISAAMKNKGRILAWDTNEIRLTASSKRFRRAGVHNVDTHVLTSETDSYIKRHKHSADWVLVDAPCTGTGTWRRSPDLKWRTRPEDVARLATLQASILRSAARLVKPGGHLVYATCSLLPHENDELITTFLAEHEGFALAPTSILPDQAHDIQLTPHHHHTDGFYAAVMQRKLV